MDDMSPLEPHLCPPHATSCPWWYLGLCLRNYKWSSVFTTHNISTAAGWGNHSSWLSKYHRSSFNFHLIRGCLISICLIPDSFTIVPCLTAAELLIAGLWRRSELWVTTRAQHTQVTGHAVITCWLLASWVETWIKTKAEQSKHWFNLICILYVVS